MRLLLEAETPVVTIVGKTWLLHVKEVLRCTPEENLAMIGDTVRFLKDHGKFVIYDAEHCFDGYKDDPEYALATLAGGGKGGRGFRRAVRHQRRLSAGRNRRASRTLRVGKLNVQIGIHTHDDIGLGVANALAALEAGATHVQGTINGYGERTGNCNLTSVIPMLAFKLKKTLRAGEVAAEAEGAFAVRGRDREHRATTRACRGSARRRSRTRAACTSTPCRSVARSYEHIDPALVGNARRVLISDLAGRSNIVMKAQELGFELTQRHAGAEGDSRTASRSWSTRATNSRRPKARSRCSSARRSSTARAAFTVDAYHVSMRRDGDEFRLRGDASRCASDGETRAHGRRGRWPGERARRRAARGAGQVLPAAGEGAADRLQSAHPRQRHRHRRAKTRVLIESTDGKREWGTVGVSDNIIEASLQALVDSMEYALMKK